MNCRKCHKPLTERHRKQLKADMVFTDPPYGISLNMGWANSPSSLMEDGRHRRRNPYKPIEGDFQPFNPAHILEAFSAVKEVFLWGGQYFMPPSQEASFICWDKKITESADKAPIGDFELCWSKAKHKNSMVRVLWNGMFGHRKGDDGDARMHPTQKPVGLAFAFFERWGKDAKLIWDGYLGSGSTLIACEKTGRKCYGMEIEPLYGDVILNRWSKFTGLHPVREDGVRWSELT